jgi:Family of unknown function (DUF5832)
MRRSAPQERLRRKLVDRVSEEDEVLEMGGAFLAREEGVVIPDDSPAPTAAPCDEQPSPPHPPRIKAFLKDDPPIIGQNFVCLSFVQPEDVLKAKEIFKMSRYFQGVTKELRAVLKNCRTALSEAAAREEMPAVVRDELVGQADVLGAVFDRHQHLWSEDHMQEDYREFRRQGPLDEEFNRLNHFRTSVRAVKVRGVFATEEEAKERAKDLGRFDGKKGQDVWVGDVGRWVPLASLADAITKGGNTAFKHDELNTLMKTLQDKDVHRDEEFEQRLRDARNGRSQS